MNWVKKTKEKLWVQPEVVMRPFVMQKGIARLALPVITVFASVIAVVVREAPVVMSQ
ncbi:hypothetical protein [Sinomicrobium oceani]|uniref:hypothetical protein n=1 Tax=Sinomicrobium oceani TaxID=1150368 RepID=UPI00158736D5|nr:hypothetical protein [Sinomicrobium oceani]